MMSPLDAVKSLLGFLLLLVLTWAGFKAYGSIKEAGRNEVRAEWAAQREADAKVIQNLRDVLAVKETKHRNDQREIADELAQQNQLHERAIASVRAEYSHRLRNSEERARRYQRQAQGGTAERDHLASHAARLDQSLEEGRGLVGELAETLRQRDRQLALLGKQIHADRALMGAGTNE